MALITISVLLTSAFAEPPIDNRYLPPHHGFNGGGFPPPSETYGPPGFGTPRRTDPDVRRPSSNFGVPSNSRRPSSQYGSPTTRNALSNQYGPPSNRNGTSNQYIPPSNQYGPPSSRNGPPSNRNGPSNQYIPPSNQYGPPSSRNGPLSNQYVPPTRQPSNQYGSPTRSQGFGRPIGRLGQLPGTKYGLPIPSQEYGSQDSGFGGNQQYSPNRRSDNLDQNRSYLPPGGGRNYNGEEGNSEPANYNFEYTVKDDASGNDFGHRESRVGERTEGVYYVVLPDGRKQTVQYEADQNGYRPKISYEDVTAGGYNRGLASGYQGNQEGY